MSEATPLIIHGVFGGAVVALMALGFALVFVGTRTFHIAQAGAFSLAAYVAAWAVDDLDLPFLVGCLVAAAAAAALGLVAVMAVYRPLERRGASELIIAMASLALVVVVDNFMTMIFTGSAKYVPNDTARERAMDLFGTSATWLQLAGVLLAVLATVAVTWALRFTPWGRSVRALVVNPILASALGLSKRRLEISIYVISSIVAAIAGIHTAIDVGALPNRGLESFLLATIAVFLGGLGSITGAVVVAFALGVAESVAVLWVPTEWALAVVFAVFVGLVVAQPHGLRPVGLEDR